MLAISNSKHFFYLLFENPNISQPTIKNTPPIGVSIPSAPKLIPWISLVARKYSEPEKRIIPVTKQ